jgi:hypothetical protein
MSIAGTSHFFGAFSSQCVDKGSGGGGGGFHYDTCLETANGINRYGKPPIIAGSWMAFP